MLNRFRGESIPTPFLYRFCLSSFRFCHFSSVFHPVQIHMAPRCPEIHRDKQTSLSLPPVPLPHGFQYDAEFTWYTRYFRTRKIMVERALDNTWKMAITPFVLTRLRAYASWISILTARKAVNPGWVRAVCASLVKVSGKAATYRACVRVRELLINPTTVVAILGIAPEEDYAYPVHSDHPAVSFDVIATTLSRRVRWS